MSVFIQGNAIFVRKRCSGYETSCYSWQKCLLFQHFNNETFPLESFYKPFAFSHNFAICSLKFSLMALMRKGDICVLQA